MHGLPEIARLQQRWASGQSPETGDYVVAEPREPQHRVWSAINREFCDLVHRGRTRDPEGPASTPEYESPSHVVPVPREADCVAHTGSERSSGVLGTSQRAHACPRTAFPLPTSETIWLIVKVCTVCVRLLGA